jgi:predicted nucleic acid-binding protein
MVDTFSLEVIYETETCVTLVEEYVKRKIIPRKYRDDARHIAVAVVNDIDVIITWNCRHMAQVEKKRMINAVNMMLGYRQIDIVTPLEVVGDG